MAITLLNPTGAVARVERREALDLSDLKGKRVGYIFNQHSSSLAFWNALEQTVAQQFEPESTHRVYKENTWAAAPRADIEQLIRETDYGLIGVGA